MKIGKDEIYSAPVVEEAVPPTSRALLHLIERDGASAALLFSLGNVYLRDEQFDAAIERYREAIRFDQFRVELNTNLGVALACIERFDEALSALRQAVLLDANQPLAHLHSGRVQLRTDDREGAFQSFERVSKLNPQSVEALLALGTLHEEAGRTSHAIEVFERAYELEPNLPAAKVRLAMTHFDRGRELFNSGAHTEAFAVWSEAYHRFLPAFSVDQGILTKFGALVKSALESGGLQAELDLFRERLLKDPDDLTGVYRVLNYFLFSVGMISECFESHGSLEAQVARWRSSLEEKGEHPYPHFRLGILAAHKGNLELADTELRTAQDKLLPKKQATLKLPQLVRFVGELREMQKLAREGFVPSSPDWEWESAGFTNPFELKNWKKSGLPPAIAKNWRDAGFTAAQAREWHRQLLPVDDAAKWLNAGFRDAKQVKKWIRAGAGPGEASAWTQHFETDVERAIQSRSAGFQDPALAAEWLKVVSMPWDAIRWHELGFTPEQAARWYEQGVTDPHAAKERQRVMGIDREETDKSD